jgi:hypothetical protein
VTSVGPVVHDVGFHVERSGYLGDGEFVGFGWAGVDVGVHLGAGGEVGPPGVFELGREGDAPAVVEALAGSEARNYDVTLRDRTPSQVGRTILMP